jgi:hypothetical protein
MAIYVLKKDNQVLYVGKTHQPQNRFNFHTQTSLKDKFNKMEIIDEYNDPEKDWIEVFEQQNIILENKNKSTSWEDWWNIGDVITSVMSPHKAKERKALKI